MARQPDDKAAEKFSTGDGALIRELALLLDETSLTEIEIERAGFRVRVARNVSIAASVPAAAPAAAPQAPAPAMAAPAAAVDMAKGNVASDEHVDVKFTSGTVSSDRLRIFNGGELVRFEGNVVMHLDNLNTAPADPSATASEAPAAPEPAPAPASSRPARTRHTPDKTSNLK